MKFSLPFIFVFAFILIIQGCMIIYPRMAPLPTDKQTSNVYFPPSTFVDDTSSRYSRSHGLSIDLNEMDEPSLFKQGQSGIEAYRLLLQPAFDPWRVIRVFKLDNELFIISKTYSNRRMGDSKNQLDMNFAGRLSTIKWEQLHEQLAEVEFWRLPVNHDDCCLDGVSCTLEGTKDSIYHVVDWPNPHNESFWKLCNFLLDLSAN